jgi:hypothetical protein
MPRHRDRDLRHIFTSVGALAASIAVGAVFGGCGDLALPSNNPGEDGGSENTTDDGGDMTMTEGDAAVASDGAPLPLNCADDAGVGHPTQLGCTGLYGNWATRTIAPDVMPFDPGLHLWSDGAEKSRFIYLPPNTKIDTTNLNEWKFPIGTKIWKEFRLLGKKVETRFLWKLGAEAWFRTTYAWSVDQQSATELTMGMPNVLGIGYEIPSTDVCATCHAGRIDMVLGFELVSLSSPASSGLNMAQLRAKQLLTNPPANNPIIPGNPVTAGALGFLHSNCGNACHNRSPSGFAGATGLFMRMEVDATGALPADPRLLDTWKTAVGVPSTFQPQGVPAGTFMRIRPGDPLTSAIPYRDGRRDGVVQMPPLATHQVDFPDVMNLVNWVSSITGP